MEKVCEREDIDLIYITTPWNLHAHMAVYAMEHGKHAVVEVPAAITIEECWQLVETSENTRKHCMMLENCCYDFFELLTLNMARQGFFGEIVHCEGAYIHMFTFNPENKIKIWRLNENINRNGNLISPILRSLAGAGITSQRCLMITPDTSLPGNYVKTWTDDAKRVVGESIQVSGVDQEEHPRLLTDNGSCYISKEFKKFIEDQDLGHVQGAPYHPQTQGKIERYHRTMKNVVKLENYFFPDELQASIESFVNYYNNERYHESLGNLTPADVYFGRDRIVKAKRHQIKIKTIKERRKINRKISA